MDAGPLFEFQTLNPTSGCILYKDGEQANVSRRIDMAMLCALEALTCNGWTAGYPVGEGA